MPMLPDVLHFSEDEGCSSLHASPHNVKGVNDRTRVDKPQRVARKSFKRAITKPVVSASPKILRHLVQSVCGCSSGSCFAPFRVEPVFSKLLQLRQLLIRMSKSEKDVHVFGILRDQPNTSCRGWIHLHLLEHPVCNRGFMKLVAIGKTRFHTLSQSVRRGDTLCPFDLRSAPREKKTPSGKRQLVHDFLMSLYLHAAEPIPDGLNSNKRPRRGAWKLDPPNLDRSGIRHLPPGSFSDFYRQCVASHPTAGIGRNLFNSVPPLPRYCFFLVLVGSFLSCSMCFRRRSFQVWMQNFSDKLRVRFSKHHSRCSQCLRHRLIIRKLGHCPPAMRMQSELLQSHLKRQHSDRCCYWDARSRSRACAANGTHHYITAIIDSMDQQKHAWPKCEQIQAKDFGSFVRPRLSNTTMLIHGHCVLMGLSPHSHTSNSSRSVELLARGLTALHQKGVDLSAAHFHVQADNCTKEVKNIGTLRFFGALVAQRKLASVTLGFLASGHSHEDVDSYFANLRSCLAAAPRLEVPDDFVTCFQKYLADPQRRPHEPSREVFMLTRFRDWCLGCSANN